MSGGNGVDSARFLGRDTLYMPLPQSDCPKKSAQRRKNQITTEKWRCEAIDELNRCVHPLVTTSRDRPTNFTRC